MYRIDNHTKHRIVCLKEEGLSITEIAETLGISRKTVYLWSNRWENEGVIQNHVSFGRPRKMSADQERHLIDHIRQGAFISTSIIATNYEVSPSTIRRRLHSSGIHHRQPARKPILTERHKLQRLNFANRYLNYDFSTVLFLDEKVFCTSQDGRVSLWRPNNTRYLQNNVLPNRRSGRLSLNFWGWMSWSGPGELIEVTTRLNSLHYRDILSEVLIPTANAAFGGNRPITFIQDGASVHNSRLVQRWIDNQDNLELIKLPPKSPDLNPIENLWGLMVQDFESTRARNINNLRDHVFELWDSFRGSSICSNMVSSMPERLQDVINNNGGYTRF